MDDPLQQTHDRAPLTGNIQPQSSRSGNNPISQSYLTSTIPGEDRRALANTIDESVWQTLSRDLFAVGEKMRQVLWPKYLLGGILQRSGGGIAGAAERGELSGSLASGRAWIGRWPDAEAVLQGGMSDGLRDWDLWYCPYLIVTDDRYLTIGLGDLYFFVFCLASFSHEEPETTKNLWYFPEFSLWSGLGKLW